MVMVIFCRMRGHNALAKWRLALVSAIALRQRGRPYACAFAHQPFLQQPQLSTASTGILMATFKLSTMPSSDDSS